ncbi:hypothetical protein PQI23_08310 [Leucobacter sp. USCH14]|uniref:hypothetical protein n=1 Tax=Leucobacter sp. USCH14 TaxID=3024838 RepID=UPI0030A0BEB3
MTESSLPQPETETAHASAAPKPTGRVLPYVVLIALLACAIYSVVAILIDGEPGFGRALDSVLAVAVFTGLIWIDTLIARRRPKWFAAVSYCGSVYLLAFWVSNIWAEDIGGHLILGFAHPATLIIVRLTLLHVDLIRVMVRKGSGPLSVFIGALTGVAASATAILLTLSLHVWGAPLLELEPYSRVWAATAMLAAFGTIALLITGVLTGARVTRTAAPEPATLMWPRLHDGTPVPATPSGAPDFSALPPNAVLAWPRYLDGTPVPARATGGRHLSPPTTSERDSE